MKILLVGLIFNLYVWQLNAQNEPVLVEAESGTLGDDYQIIEEDEVTLISPMTDFVDGITSRPELDDKVASYSVSFPEAGAYDLYARIRVGNETADDDSFFLGNGFGEKSANSEEDWHLVNNLYSAGYTDDAQTVSGIGNAQNNVWKWVNVSEFLNQTQPVTYTVSGDLDTVFMIGAREDGLEIDKFAFARADYVYTVGNLDNGESGSEPDPVETEPQDPIAKGSDKFLGNIWSTSQEPDFTYYWNQVTPENAGKWGSVERIRGQMSWGALDAAYNLAKENGFPFKHHVLVWGSQQPNWLDELSEEEQLYEIEEWFGALAQRYPDIDIIEVVNEPLHQPPLDYMGSLGDSGETGWDWVIQSFTLARQYFPNTELMLNDYGILGDNNAIRQYKEIIELLKERNLIDQIGVQGHAFTVNSLASEEITSSLDELAATGLPIFVTELDIDGPTDEIQLNRYKEVFPALWEHPAVRGITLWGYRPGMWRSDQMAYLIDNQGNERPALIWLREYVENGIPEKPTPAGIGNTESRIEVYPNPVTNGSLTIPSGLKDVNGMHMINLQGQIHYYPVKPGQEVRVEVKPGTYVLQLLKDRTPLQNGKVIIR